MNKAIARKISDLRMVLIMMGMIALFSVLSPYFFTMRNLSAVGLNISVIGIVCIGQTLVLLTGMFDLSVGGVAGFIGMVVAILTKEYGMYPLMLVFGVVLGALIGMINGLLITKGRVNALITTLSMMTIFQGMTFLISKGYAVGINMASFRFLGTYRLAGIPLPIIILVVLYLLFYFILNNTVFGRYVYSIGGNRLTARLSGINVDVVQIMVFMIAGMLYAFAGILLASRLGSAQVGAGSQYPLNSIAACVLGGITLAGGEGNILGALIGVAIVGILQSGLIMIDMPTYYQWIATGVVLIIAVYYDEKRRKELS